MKFINELSKEELLEKYNTNIDGNFICRKTNNRNIGYITIRSRDNEEILNESINDIVNSTMLCLPNTKDFNVLEIKVNQVEKLYPYNIILSIIINSIVKYKKINPYKLIFTLEANDLDIQVDVNRNEDNISILRNNMLSNKLFKKFIFKDRNELLFFLLKYHFLNYVNTNKEYNFKLNNDSYYILEKENAIYLTTNSIDILNGIMNANMDKYLDDDDKIRHISDVLYIHFAYIEDIIKNNTRLFVNCYLNNIPLFENKEEIYNIIKEGLYNEKIRRDGVF